MLKYIFQRPMPFGCSQLWRAAYLFNQSHSCRRVSPALGRRALRTPSISKRWAPPHQQTLLPGFTSKSAGWNPESRSHALKVGAVTNASQFLFGKDRHIASSLTGSGNAETESGQDKDWKTGLGLVKTSQAMLVLDVSKGQHDCSQKIN